ncbi:MAG: N-acetyltransferase [Candidatus Bathyarchaeia archaeon]|jgi:ribosomal protein S18 acetylase RimI-like enzyme
MALKKSKLTPKNLKTVLKFYYEEDIMHDASFLSYLYNICNMNLKLLLRKIAGVSIYVDNRIVGCALATINGVEAHVYNVIIKEEFRGRGFGKVIMSALVLSLFKEYNVERIFVDVFEDNIVAFRLYQNMGFTKEKTLFRLCLHNPIAS